MAIEYGISAIITVSEISTGDFGGAFMPTATATVRASLSVSSVTRRGESLLWI